jgi:hypothetical protein
MEIIPTKDDREAAQAVASVTAPRLVAIAFARHRRRAQVDTLLRCADVARRHSADAAAAIEAMLFASQKNESLPSHW